MLSSVKVNLLTIIDSCFHFLLPSTGRRCADDSGLLLVDDAALVSHSTTTLEHFTTHLVEIRINYLDDFLAFVTLPSILLHAGMCGSVRQGLDQGLGEDLKGGPNYWPARPRRVLVSHSKTLSRLGALKTSQDKYDTEAKTEAKTTKIKERVPSPSISSI